MAKQRSPNFPKFDLETAITKISQVYQAEHTHAADKEVVARDLGYTSLNGASLTTIGALNSFGLLEPEGDGLKVSGDAVTILELPTGHAERVDALRRRAYAPKLFADLKQEFGDNLPSDVNLRHSLIKKKFLPKAADEAIRVYRETIRFVSDEANEYNAPDAGKPKGESKPAGGAPHMQQQQTPTPTGPKEPTFGAGISPVEPRKLTDFRPLTELSFKLSRDSDAKITIYGEASQEAIKKLRALLELSEDTFPTKEEIERPKARAAKETATGIPEDELEFTESAE